MQMGHISVRHPRNPDVFLIKRSGIGLEEVRAPSDIVTVDFSGRRVAGTGAIHKEWPIHAEIYRARRDVRAVVHAHPTYAVALSLAGTPLKPAGQPGAFFPDGVAIFDETTDIITTREMAARMAAALGSADALILKGHGVVVCGRSIEEACVGSVLLERAARIQSIAQALGPITWPSPEMARAKKASAHGPESVQGRWEYLVRGLRRTRCMANTSRGGDAR